MEGKLTSWHTQTSCLTRLMLSWCFSKSSSFYFNDLHVLASVHLTPFPAHSPLQQSCSPHWSMLLCTCRYLCIMFPVTGILFFLPDAKPCSKFKSELVLNYVVFFSFTTSYSLFFQLLQYMYSQNYFLHYSSITNIYSVIFDTLNSGTFTTLFIHTCLQKPTIAMYYDRYQDAKLIFKNLFI